MSSLAGNLAYLFSNSRKVACRNTKLLGIKGYIPLHGTIAVYQVNELFEQLPFPVASFQLFLREVSLHLIIRIQKKYLKQVLGNALAELVFLIGINSSTCLYHSQDGTYCFGSGMCITGILLHEMYKCRVQTETGHLHHFCPSKRNSVSGSPDWPI